MDAFSLAHRAEWDQLNTLVRRRRRLTGAEADELVRLYQRASTHLSQVRDSAGADPGGVARLTTLVGRARSAVMGAQVPAWRIVARFAAVDLPAAVYRARWWWVGTTVASLVVALATGWWIARSPDVQSALLPPAAAKALVQQQFKGYYTASPAAAFAAQVWTNNLWIAAYTLVLGILIIPPLWILLENAVNVGVNGGYLFAHGKGTLFFSLILPHGMLELSAVFLAAAAGLRLGWTVFDPGGRRRGQALAEEGRAMITIAIGCVGALAVSGVIEAFVTPSSLPTWARIGIGAIALSAFLGYSLGLGRRAVASGHTGDIEYASDALPVA